MRDARREGYGRALELRENGFYNAPLKLSSLESRISSLILLLKRIIYVNLCGVRVVICLKDVIIHIVGTEGINGIS